MRRRIALSLSLAAGIAPLLIGSCFADQLKNAHWIWPHKKVAADEVAHFRKSFTVQGDIKQARLYGTCDNHLLLLINGRQAVRHDAWNRCVDVDVSKFLRRGENVLAVRGKNDRGPAGLLLGLKITLQDGTKQTLVTDASWDCACDAVEGWESVALDLDANVWKKAQSLGKIGSPPWGLLEFAHLRPRSTSPDSIRVADGFRVERIYSVSRRRQGSWVSMTPDYRGRLICSAQRGGLYRVTPGADEASTRVERLDVAIGDAQGLLYAFDSLYVSINGFAAQGSGFYRLRDTNGDDQFDEVKLLKKFEGEGEHGPHGIRLGPDGRLYVIAGNHTKIPQGIVATSPHRNWAEDLLLPRNPDGRGHATGIMAPGGWIARTDRDGKTWDLFCAGLRNPYDIDFNQEAELFTYDADMEYDTGAPWYRPTRVNHAVSAAEFGWRYGTGKWPAYYADSLGAVIDIGLASPTGVSFGTGAKFPAKYQRALLINDWTYGVIYAVHMKPKGASYEASFERFISGKPLPVTDVVVNPGDGALYFTIGGRGTQSGLYRVTYVGDEPTTPVGPLRDDVAAAARGLRHQLESFHGRENPAAIDVAWPHLNSPDRAIRYAARVAIEHQPLASWKEKALAEGRSTAAIQALLALTRTGDATLQKPVLARLEALPYERLSDEQLLDALRVYQLAFIRLGGKSPQTAADAAVRLGPLFPHESDLVSRELCRLLVYLEAPGLVKPAMQRLAESRTQQDQMFYAFVLRNLKTGWALDQQRAYFGWLNHAASEGRGGQSFQRFIEQTREDALAKLDEPQKAALKDVIEARAKVEIAGLQTTRQFVHNWQMDDLSPLLPDVDRGRSFDKGYEAFQSAQCAKCHRFDGHGGATGPDLTGVGNRFSPQYLLEALVDPSKVVSDQYRNSIIVTDGGEIVTGRVIERTADALRIRTSPFARHLTTLSLDEIEDSKDSEVSEMPLGLINVLTKDEILDLIAYMRSGGDRHDKAFAPDEADSAEAASAEAGAAE